MRNRALGGCRTAIVLIVASATGVHSKEVRGHPPQTLSEQQTNPSEIQKPSSPDKRGTLELPFVVRSLAPEKTQQETDDDARERNDKRWNDRATLVISVTTLLILLLQTIVFGRQAIRLRQTIEVMKKIGADQSRDIMGSIAVAEAANNFNREISVASRRAWVSIEDVKLTHPTKFIEDGIVFCVQATTKNLGHTPATCVWLDFESYFVENNSEIFPDAEKRFKAQLRERPLQLGELLFPGDTYTLSKRWTDGIEKIKDAIGTRPSGEKRIGFTVFIGLSYTIVGDSSPHITYHAHEMLNVPIGTAIQPDQLVDLPRQPFLAGEAD